MSDRRVELVLKAVHALTAAERDDLLVELLLGGGGAADISSQVPPPARGTSLTDAERLAAVLGGPVEVAGPASAMKVLPIRLPEGIHERLRAFCAANGFSMAVVIRTLVERFLDQQTPAGGSGGRPRPSR